MLDAPRMTEMYRSGQSLRDIGPQFGVSHETVRRKLVGTTLTPAEERRRRRFFTAWGMTPDEFEAHIAEWGTTADKTSPMRRYKKQRYGAKRRGIAWAITFKDWWAVWQESGRWSERGKRGDDGGGYVMARHGDIGAYSLSNVEIITMRQNTVDGNNNRVTKNTLRAAG